MPLSTHCLSSCSARDQRNCRSLPAARVEEAKAPGVHTWLQASDTAAWFTSQL